MSKRSQLMNMVDRNSIISIRVSGIFAYVSVANTMPIINGDTINCCDSAAICSVRSIGTKFLEVNVAMRTAVFRNSIRFSILDEISFSGHCVVSSDSKKNRVVPIGSRHLCAVSIIAASSDMSIISIFGLNSFCNFEMFFFLLTV